MELLRDAIARPLTLMRAPAGYGKTTAVHQLLDATPCAAVWPAVNGTASPRDTWRQISDDTERFLQTHPQAAEPAILVLEGMDRDGNGSASGWDAVWQQLTHLIDGLPPSHRILVVTRGTPHLPLGRWRAQGRVSEVGRDDLRFQPDETRLLLEQLGHSDVAGHHVLALTDRAEGWPAGLGLLTHSLGHRVADQSAILDQPLDRDAGRSLLAEILDDQPPEVRDFLVTTSVLERFSADVCRAVTGSDEAGRLLRAVEEANLFVVSLDEDREWFRYHRLFAELLRKELVARGRDAVDQLHQRAAVWFKEHRDVRQALGHLSRAGRPRQALFLANEDAYRSWWESSFLGTDWSELFPTAWVEDDPERMIGFAMLLGRSGQMDRTRSWLDRAERDLQNLPADHPGHLSLLGANALWHAVHLHARRAVELSRQALSMLDDDLGLHSESRLLRDRLLMAMLTCFWLLDDLDSVEEVCAMLERDSELGLQASGVMRDIVVPASRARLASRRGDLHEAYELGQSVLHTTRTMGFPHHPARRDAELAVAEVLAEWGDLEQAEQLIGAIVHERDKVGWFAISAMTRVELADARLLCRGPQSGLAVIGEARSVVRGQPAGSELISALDAFEARLRIHAGDLQTGRKLLDQVPSCTWRTHLRVRLAVSQGRAEHAAELLRTTSPSTPRQQVVTNLLAARVASALGQQSDRDRYMSNAIALGTEKGFRRTLAIEAPELTRLTTRFDAGPVSPVPVTGSDPVTDREMSVLRYLPSRLTNREIATELEVSDNTLKTHLRSLYRKLGVNSRSDAVAQARRVGIL